MKPRQNALTQKSRLCYNLSKETSMKKLSIAIVVYIFINKCFYRKFLNQKKSNLYGSTLIGQGGKTVWVKIKE